MQKTQVFFDIETIPLPEPGEDFRQPPPEEASEANHEEYEAWRMRGVEPMTAKIVCVVLAVNAGKIEVFRGEEEDITKNLEERLARISNIEWVAHNAEFDALILRTRALKYGAKSLLRMINGDRYRGNVACTLELLSGGIKWKYKVSLEKCCQFFGIQTPKDQMKGDEVYSYFLEGRIDEICNYCAKDVIATRKLWMAITGKTYSNARPTPMPVNPCES